MFSIIKFIFFVFVCSGFGFTALSQITRISSLILLIPLSITFGIASFVFLCHLLAYLIGPQGASVLSLFILLLLAVIILFIKKKHLIKIETEISKKQLIIINLIAITICTLTFLGIYRFGTFDRAVHMPMSMTIIHNNIYPPRDPFRPNYVLLYHFGGDLLAGTVHYICNLDISTSFELISVIFSSTTFLSFFALGWILTKSFRLSLISGFCTYFSGGLLWLDAIIRYITKNFPEGISNWGFIQTFLNLGIHGGFNNAPSIQTFISTFNLGNPLTVFCLILFWKMIEGNNLKLSFFSFYALFLNIALFTLSLTADWLYATFWGAVLPFLFVLYFKKQKEAIGITLSILIISILLNKSIGNPLFLQDSFQNLGRTNIFDIGIKEKLFWIVSWGRLAGHVMNYQNIYAFSWDFICEIGLSLFLFPIALIYLIKHKNMFALLLFLTAITTMPIPLIIDFKLNPVELVRLFEFGNSMLVLLITCATGILFKTFFKKKILILTYLTVFCLSPIAQLFTAIIFTSYAFTNYDFVQLLCDEAKEVKSYNEFKTYCKNLNDYILTLKNRIEIKCKNEIEFLRSHSKPLDVTISNFAEIPSYAGVYSLIPKGRFIYWDQLYSSHATIVETAFATLDPHLLNELNIKWILITDDFRIQLSKEAQSILNNPEICKLVYDNYKKEYDPTKERFEIYQINDNIKNILNNYKQKTGWVLVNSLGQYQMPPFLTSKDALSHLKLLQETYPALRKELITAEPLEFKTQTNEIKK